MTTIKHHSRRTLLTLGLVLGVVVSLTFATTEAQASHFRGGTISWVPTGTTGEVEFRIKWFERGGTTPVGSADSIAITFGDGFVGTATGTVTANNAAEDWYTSDMKVKHVYAGTGPYTAFVSNCCRLSPPSSYANGNGLNNSSDQTIRLETLVRPRSGNNSPTSSLPPIVTTSKSTNATFTIPVSDLERDPIRFRLATVAEKGGGTNTQPSNLSINPNTGVVTWNNFSLSTTGYYSVQVMIEDLDGSGNVKSKTPLDFLLKVLNVVGNRPTLSISPAGPLSVSPGNPVTFTVTGNDVDANARVTLNNGGLPSGMVLSSGSPMNAALIPPVSSTFTWTPTVAQAGSYTISFTATDDTFQQALASINIFVESNSPPTIQAMAISRTAGSPATDSQITTVNDTETPKGSLVVTVMSAPAGISITSISAPNATTGVVTATVAAACTATVGTNTVVLKVTDGNGATATANLTVNVTANTAPTVGAYANKGVAAGGNVTVTPNAAPMDNGSIAGVTATAMPNTFTGTFSGNTATGALMITNAGPSGAYTITVTVTDNCGATVQQTFTLTVNTPPTINAVAATRQQGSGASNSTIATVGDVDQAAGMLSVVVTSANPSSGVTVSNVVNSGGTITADIVADCTASNAGFTLTVTDSAGATATATLNVTVTANTAPVLTYDNQTVGAAASLTVNPATGPSDNGSVASFAVLSVTPALLTAPTVAGNGVVTITNAGPSGNHTITIRATDNCGLTTDASFTLNVTCPTLTLNPASLPAGTVGLPYLSTSFNATGGNGTVNYALSGTLPAKMAFVSGQLTDTPTEAGSFSLTITATDAYGCSVSKSYTLVVSCPTIIINPSASALPIAQINQAYPTQTFSASSGNAPYTLVLNGALPVGMSFANGQLSGTPTSFGSFPLTLNVTDKYGCTASRNYMLLVNRPPVALAQNVTVTAGANCTANADINNGSSDPDGDTLSFTQSPAGPYAVGTRTVTLTVDDGRGGVSTSTATVTVNAPKPVPVITGPASGTIYQVGTPVNFTGTFADLAGTTHTASWKFESATPPAITMAGTLVEPAGSNPGTTSVMQSFTTPGVYLMTLTVTNQCLGAGSVTTIGVDQFSALVVIYDPGAGFATGGGWINSPAGAYTADLLLTGKANFGFVSKYPNGANVPTGNTEFQFKAGNLNFKSTVYEWLVVAGARAQYKGSGKINGAGDYRFMLTVIDGQQPGGGGQDKFRIRIWDNAGGGLVYDNQLNAPDNDDPTTVLGGGSIVIHK